MKADQELFRYISPDPEAAGEDFPESPYWHPLDILAIARTVLRRRSAEEVKERAELLMSRLRAYQADVIAITSEFQGEEGSPLRQDDAGDLEFLTTPNSAFPFRHTTAEDATDAPWVAETGWIPAEDQAILALLKVDAAAGHLISRDSNSNAAAVCLLDAYRSCVIAIQGGGLLVQTKDEANALVKRMSEIKTLSAKRKKQVATYARRSQKLKLLVVERYRQLREELPNNTSKRKIALQVSEEYDKPTDYFREYDGTLRVNEAEGTTSLKRIYDWILNADEFQSLSPDDHESETLKAFEKALSSSRKKHLP